MIRDTLSCGNTFTKYLRPMSKDKKKSNDLFVFLDVLPTLHATQRVCMITVLQVVMNQYTRGGGQLLDTSRILEHLRSTSLYEILVVFFGAQCKLIGIDDTGETILVS